MELARNKELVTKDDPKLSVSKQCKLLGLDRSSVYYKEKQSGEFEIQVKHAIEEMHTAHPAWGTRRIAATLVTKGYLVGRKLVRRYMQEFIK